jgi:hypothetical protein
MVTQPVLQLRQVADGAVVGHDPALHRERMCVLRRRGAGRSLSHVAGERGRGQVPGLARERDVVVGGDRLLVQHRRAVGREDAKTGAVGVLAALLG